MNALMGPTSSSDIWLCLAHTRFGPNTIAKLYGVILFRSLHSITCEKKMSALKKKNFHLNYFEPTFTKNSIKYLNSS